MACVSGGRAVLRAGWAGRSSLAKPARSSLTTPLINITQIRTTWRMERVFDVPLARLGQEPHLRRLQFLYKPTNTMQARVPDITVILTQYVEGVGDVGDEVTVRAYIARNELLLAGLAVYNTPENRHKYSNMKLDRPRRTPFCMKTLRQLENSVLYVPMSAATDAPLTPDIVRVAFRLAGVELSSECIVLPEEQVTASSQEDFTVQVLMNGLFTAQVTARIYPYRLDATGKPQPPLQNR